MSPDAVMTRLSSQSESVVRASAPCPSDKRLNCVTEISAGLPDGSIEVAFRDTASNPGAVRVWRVQLLIKGRGVEDRDLVRESAVVHYGMPNLDDPAWCWPDDTGKECRPDEPSLVFKPLDGAAGLFVLSAPDG